MKKRTKTVLIYLLMTFCLMWLLPFLIFSCLNLSNYFLLLALGVIVGVIAFVVQMVLTYKMRCAWAWLWTNVFFWGMILVLLICCHNSTATAQLMDQLPFVFSWLSLIVMGFFLLAEISKLFIVLVIVIYVASFIVQLILEYRQRKKEAVLAVNADVEESQEEAQNEKGIDK